MIVQLVTRLAMGGAQEIVLRTSSHLDKNNIPNLIITGLSEKNSLAAPDNTLLDEALKQNLNIRIINHLSDRINLLKDLFSMISIFKILKEVKPDIVHIHSSKTGLLGRLLKFFFRNTHFIYHVHGWSFSRYEGIKKKIIFKLESFLYYFTDSYIFVCQYDLDQFVELGGNKNITAISEVIYPGVDFVDKELLDSSRLTLRKMYDIEENHLLVGNIARLDKQKDPFLFINMAAELKKTINSSKLKFIWIGSGSLEKECKDLVCNLSLIHISEPTRPY